MFDNIDEKFEEAGKEIGGCVSKCFGGIANYVCEHPVQIISLVGTAASCILPPVAITTTAGTFYGLVKIIDNNVDFFSNWSTLGKTALVFGGTGAVGVTGTLISTSVVAACTANSAIECCYPGITAKVANHCLKGVTSGAKRLTNCLCSFWNKNTSQNDQGNPDNKVNESSNLMK